MIQVRLILFGVSVIAAAGFAAYTYFTSNSEKVQSYQSNRTSSRSSDGNSSKSICTICLVDLGEFFTTLSCNHSFHKNCIQKWRNLNPSCPLCRCKPGTVYISRKRR